MDTAKSNGLDSINNIQPTVVKKDEAKQRLIKRRKLKTEIDQTPNATDEEKRQKAKVDEAVTTAKNAIDQATNNAGVDTAKTNGVDSINNVQPTVVKKDEAKQRLIKRRKLKSGNRPNTKRDRRRKAAEKRKSMRQ